MKARPDFALPVGDYAAFAEILDRLQADPEILGEGFAPDARVFREGTHRSSHGGTDGSGDPPAVGGNSEAGRREAAEPIGAPAPGVARKGDVWLPPQAAKPEEAGMRIITAPTPETLRSLGLNPKSGLGESVSEAARRSTMLAWHLNRWILGKSGGADDRPWLADPSGLSAEMVADFGERVRRYDRALKGAGADGAEVFGCEFLQTARLWKSACNISGILVLHAGFDEECRRLARETGLPVRLTDPLLRSWLLLLFRCASPECPVTCSPLKRRRPGTR